MKKRLFTYLAKEMEVSAPFNTKKVITLSKRI